VPNTLAGAGKKIFQKKARIRGRRGDDYFSNQFFILVLGRGDGRREAEPSWAGRSEPTGEKENVLRAKAANFGRQPSRNLADFVPQTRREEKPAVFSRQP